MTQRFLRVFTTQKFKRSALIALQTALQRCATQTGLAFSLGRSQSPHTRTLPAAIQPYLLSWWPPSYDNRENSLTPDYC